MTTPDSSPPRVIFVNRVYWPAEAATAQLLTDLAEGLAARGFAVTVITSGNRNELRAGVTIQRVCASGRNARHLPGKFFAYLSFTLSACWRLVRVLRPGDTLVIMTDPPLFSIAGAMVARLRGARVIHWVQDIHPEIIFALQPQRSWLRFLLRPLQCLRNRSWQRAVRCVAISRDMGGFIGARGVAAERIAIMENWADDSILPSAPGAGSAVRRDWGLAEKFVVAYSGNLGRVHNLQPLLEAAAILRTEPGIAFLFIGAGPQRAMLEQQVRSQGLINVLFQPAQPRESLAATLAAGDVHVIALRDGCEQLVYPSKLYGILAAGRPVLFIGPVASGQAELVRAHQCGLSFAGHDTAGLAAAIRRLAADPGRVAALGSAAAAADRIIGRKGRAVSQWEKILSDSASGTGLRPAANPLAAPPQSHSTPPSA